MLSGFALGSVPWGPIVAAALGRPDPRSAGSGSIGATNVLRTGGGVAALLVLVLDVAKGSFAVLLAAALSSGSVAQAGAATAAVAGHIFTPWLRFRGGKGVATGAGAWFVATPLCAGAAGTAFLAAALLSRRVSVGSLAAALVLPVATHLLGAAAGVSIAAWATSALIALAHRDNVRRLFRGEEPRIVLWKRRESGGTR